MKSAFVKDKVIVVHEMMKLKQQIMEVFGMPADESNDVCSLLSALTICATAMRNSKGAIKPFIDEERKRFIEQLTEDIRITHEKFSEEEMQQTRAEATFAATPTEGTA